MGRTFCLGDVHGWASAILELFEKVNFDYENDKLIFIGDFCDRGPDSWSVIEIFLKIKNFVWLTGNHDHCFKQYLLGNKDYDEWVNDMGKQTLKSYKEHKWENIENHKKLLFSTVPYHVENNICFVHGGIDRYKFIEIQLESFLAWDRQLVNNMMYTSGRLFDVNNFDKIFIGHTPTICWNEGDEKLNEKLGFMFVTSISNPIYYPIIKESVYLIDTGCGKNGPLTLYDVYNNVYHQTDKKYKKIG